MSLTSAQLTTLRAHIDSVSAWVTPHQSYIVEGRAVIHIIRSRSLP